MKKKDWDTDLDKYNFNTVELTADVLNAVPPRHDPQRHRP